MDLRVWSGILAADRDVESLVARTFADASAVLDLGALRGAVRRRLEALRVALASSLSAELAIEVLVPLLFMVDERVLGRLADLGFGRELGWVHLQRDLFPAEDGGDVFFERADDLLRGETTPAILLEVYLYCLHAGFEGRHADDPPARDRYKARLAERIPVPASPSPPPPRSTPPKQESTRSLVILTVGAIAALNVILFTFAAALW